MKSVSGKYWEEEKYNQRIIDKIKVENNFSELITRLIIRNSFDKDEIYSINNDLEITNPFKKNKDFLNAVKIFNHSILNKEKICIIGDYDVDGCVSASLIVKILKIQKIPHFYHIPNRFKDGYGANLELLKKIIEKKPNLIILVDNGSNAIESINFLNKHSIRTIIIDHHEIYKPYPKCGSLINPKKGTSSLNYSYFCSAVLTYFFLEIYLNKKSLKFNLKENLILVLMAIISDVMPLRKINRLIAIKVIKNLNSYDNYIFRKIFEIKKINKPIEIDDFAFLFGPIINSIGRIDDANDVVNLLCTNNTKKKDELINKLIKSNEKRKLIEEHALKEINFKKITLNSEPIIFLDKGNFNEGIIGIIASRLKYYFNKPSIVLTKSGNLFKGSSRSTKNFNIGLYIKRAIDQNILENGGGHNLAAGFSVKKENINVLKEFLIDAYNAEKPIISNNYLYEISLNAINKNFVDEINSLNPYGEGIKRPLFLIKNIKITKPKIIKDKFIKCYLKNKSSKMLPAVSFNYIGSDITKNLLYNKKEVNLIIQLNEKFWNNKKQQQIIIVDLLYDSNNA